MIRLLLNSLPTKKGTRKVRIGTRFNESLLWSTVEELLRVALTKENQSTRKGRLSCDLSCDSPGVVIRRQIRERHFVHLGRMVQQVNIYLQDYEETSGIIVGLKKSRRLTLAAKIHAEPCILGVPWTCHRAIPDHGLSARTSPYRSPLAIWSRPRWIKCLPRGGPGPAKPAENEQAQRKRGWGTGSGVGKKKPGCNLLLKI